MHFCSWLLHTTFVISVSAFYPFNIPNTSADSSGAVVATGKHVASRTIQEHEDGMTKSMKLGIKRRAPPAS